MPRADAGDGLVALASIVSKTVRELWMDIFNAYWQARVPGLRPTAGYHVDAIRFRRDIEAAARRAAGTANYGGAASETIFDFGLSTTARRAAFRSKIENPKSGLIARDTRCDPWSGRRE